MIDTVPRTAWRIVCTSGLLLFSGCTLPEVRNLVPGTTAQLPAAGYYHWAASAEPEAREEELVRLETALANGDSVAARVQRAVILRFHDGDGQDELQQIDIAVPSIAQCEQQIRCRDYLGFASILQDLRALEQRLDIQTQEIRNQMQETQNYGEENRGLHHEIQALRVRIEALAEENQRLQEQIEALTVIERQLLEQEQNQE